MLFKECFKIVHVSALSIRCVYLPGFHYHWYALAPFSFRFGLHCISLMGSLVFSMEWAYKVVDIAALHIYIHRALQEEIKTLVFSLEFHK